MKQSPFWEANSHSASQEIPCLTWNPNIHHHVHKNLPLVPMLIQMNLVHNFPPKIHSCIFSHLCLGLPGFPAKIFYAFLISPMHATWPTHHIRDLIAVTTFGKVCKLWGSSLCILFQPLVTSSEIPSVHDPLLVWEMMFHTHTHRKAFADSWQGVVL